MILVVGGFGFIGTHVTRSLLDAGESCVVVARRAVTPLEHERLAVERVDVTDRAAFLRIGERHRITGIVNLAGAFGFADPDPLTDARLTVESLLTVLEAARRWAVPRVGFASTIGVYAGAEEKAPLREDVPLPMSSPHGIPAFKKIGELLGDHLARATGLEIVNYRIAGVWGPGGRPASLFIAAPAMIHAAARGTAPDFSGLRGPVHADDGIDLVYARDCGAAIAGLATAETLGHATYNVAAGRPTTNGEVAAAIAEVVPDARIDLLPGRDPAGPGENTYLDIDRLRTDTGYVPRYDTDRAVADYLAWLRAGHER